MIVSARLVVSAVALVAAVSLLFASPALRKFLADSMRGTVRCAFPLVTVGALAGLLFSGQGTDVLRALIDDRAASGALTGFVFLGVACIALSVSVWYSMRWLLTADMPGLPLKGPPGPFRSWLPRLFGGFVPLLVTFSVRALAGSLDESMQSTAEHVEIVFALIAVLLVAFYALRGYLIEWLIALGWLEAAAGRAGRHPGVLGGEVDTPALTLRFIVWSVATTLLIGVLLTLFPVTLPRVIGAAAVAALALASINLFGSFVLTYWPLRHGLPLLAPWTLVLAAVCGFYNDNHVVRPATQIRDLPPGVTETQTFAQFVEGLRGALPAEAKVPVIFIASEGGGIRAAYWTAAVLEALQDRVDVARRTYALSGVSGGSLGVAAWATKLRSERCPGPARPEAADESRLEITSATASLGADFVSPAIAGLFYYDLAQRFIPYPFPALDRGYTIEDGWQRAFVNARGKPFEHTIAEFYRGCDRRLPLLLLNATRVETGQRTVLTLLPTDVGGTPDQRSPFTDTFDAMTPALLARNQPLAGLVHHSARFPVVSPPGTIGTETSGAGTKPVRLVDGGYFDNSGVQSTVELIETLRAKFGKEHPFDPIVLIVRNDEGGQVADDAGGFLPETWGVIGTLLAVRGAHAVLIRESAERRGDLDAVTLTLPKETQAPLGWALSQSVRDKMLRSARVVAARAAEQLSALGVEGR